MNILEVEGLRVSYSLDGDRHLQAVGGIDFRLGKGEIMGIAGESGCGKTTTVNAIMRILPPSARSEGRIMLEGKDLLSLAEKEMRKVRWGEVSIIFQDAQEALNPIQTVERQIAEPLVVHRGLDKREAVKRARELLELVGVKAERGSDYPHQLSGGMKQRGVIAMALACRAKLVIADEPTTALDVMVQAQILNLLRDLQSEYSLSLIYISHNLSVLSELCERITIMYAGDIVEIAPTEELFERPQHPYTIKLLEAIPTIAGSSAGRLATIPGSTPRLVDPEFECRFYDRCSEGTPECLEGVPPLVEVRSDHYAACFKREGIEEKDGSK